MTGSNPALIYLSRLGSHESRRKVMSILNDLAIFMGGKDHTSPVWHHLNHDVALRYINQSMDRGLAPATMATHLAALRRVARDAWLEHQIDGETYQRILTVTPPRGSRVPKGRSIDHQETDELLETCASDARPQGLRDAAMMALLIVGGLRRSELVKLDMEHLVVRDQAVRVLGKGNKERMVYLSEEAWLLLDRWLDQARGRDPGPLFVRILKGGAITRSRLTDHAVRFILRQRCALAGIDVLSPHDLRRTLATWLLESDVDIATVQDMLGHASINTTRLYDRRGDQRKKDAAQRIRLRSARQGG